MTGRMSEPFILQRISPLKQNIPLCLASSSPRRRALLEQFGLRFVVQGADVDESLREGEAPEDYAARLAGEKARAVREGHGGHGILAGDTIVVIDGDVLGKPGDEGQAKAMIRRLSGRTHRVISGVFLLEADSGWSLGRTVETAVTFRGLPASWIDWYSRQPEAMDKAGAYAVQGVGSAMVERIEGSYANVVGFPIETLFWDMFERGWLSL